MQKPPSFDSFDLLISNANNNLRHNQLLCDVVYPKGYLGALFINFHYLLDGFTGALPA